METKLQSPEVWADQKLASELGQKSREIKDTLEQIKKWDSTIEDAETKIRIYQAASLILQDYSIDEIVEVLHSTYDIIYDDLTSRLPKLDVKIAEDVKKKLLEHRLQNLPQYKDNIPASFFTPKGNSKK